MTSGGITHPEPGGRRSRQPEPGDSGRRGGGRGGGSGRPGPGGGQGGGRRPRASRWIPAAALAVAVGITAVMLVTEHPASRPSATGGSKPARTPAPVTLPTGPLVPAHGALFGAYAQPAGGYSYSQFESAIMQLERGIHRKLAIDSLYAPWAHPLPIGIAQWDLKQGTMPMISWAGANTSQIASGAYDRMFRASAIQLRDLHGPVMLRWFYEMEGSAARSMVRSPASYIAAWRHVHDIFARAGASNVSWVWCPNALHFFDGVAQSYYPGGRYVSWICADGYNWAPKLARAPWKSFADIFSAFYSWGIRANKPLMIGEFGVLERSAGEKAAWYRRTDRQLRTMFPAIRAVVYFNSDHQGFDWRMTTSPSALAAFRAFATDPYFRAMPRV